MSAIRAVCEVAAWLREKRDTWQRELDRCARAHDWVGQCAARAMIDFAEAALAKCRQVAAEEACDAEG